MIVVTGMHRSGTSMVCQLLSQLGVDFGDPSNFYATDEWNAEGYFEVRDIQDVNSRLITGFQRNKGWLPETCSKLAYLTLPRKETIRKRAKRMRGEIDRLATRFARHAVKDPRFCLTLDCWEQVAPVEKYVVCVRHPTEVARSLKRRQHIPLWWGYRFWSYHMEHLLGHLPTKRSVFVDFNRLAGGVREGELTPLTSFLSLDVSSELAKTACDAVFKADLVHCSASSPPELPPRTKMLWTRLIETAANRRQFLLNSAT